MIFQTFSSIDDTEFTTIFQDSLAVLDAGSYPWHLFPLVISQDDKKAHIREAYNQHLTESFVWEVREANGKLLMLNVGTIEGDTVRWFLSLISPNTAGTKSYLYSPEYSAVRNSFWASHGVSTFTMESFGTTIGQHVASRVSSGTMYGTSAEAARDLTAVELTDVSVTMT